MNVGLILPGFSANESDWCIPAFLDLVRSLTARHHVRVLALRYPYSKAEYEVYRARVSALDGREKHGLAGIALRAQALNWVRQEHRTHPFDVLHAFFADEAGLVAALAGRMLKVPAVVSLAGGELVGLRDIGYGGQLTRTARAANRFALSLASRVTAGSRVYETWTRQFADAAKVIYAPLGVDTQLFLGGPNTPRDEFILLHIASMVPVKDQMRLLKIFRQVRARVPRAHLKIVGTGPLERALKNCASEFAIEGCVEFLGSVEHHRLVDIYREADVFVLTSRYEAQGMVALEAAACGLPVIGTRVGVLPEIGLAEDDDEALVNAIVRLENEPDAREGLRMSARTQIEREFSLDTSLARWEGIYEGLVSTHGNPLAT